MKTCFVQNYKSFHLDDDDFAQTYFLNKNIASKKVIDDIICYTEEAKEKLENKNRQFLLNDFFTPK